MKNLFFFALLLLFGCQSNTEAQNFEAINFTPLSSEEAINHKIYEDDYIILDSLDNWYPVNDDFILRLKLISMSPVPLDFVYGLKTNTSDTIDLPFIMIQHAIDTINFAGASFDKKFSELEKSFAYLKKSPKYKSKEIDFSFHRDRGVICVTTKSENQIFGKATQISYLFLHEKGTTSILLFTDEDQNHREKLDEMAGKLFFKQPLPQE
jgi:hypothetical protein